MKLEKRIDGNVSQNDSSIINKMKNSILKYFKKDDISKNLPFDNILDKYDFNDENLVKDINQIFYRVEPKLLQDILNNRGYIAHTMVRRYEEKMSQK
ncbi:MAG: hypothetical protein ACOC16_03715 [Nanoarchaeota archaeon]